MMSANRALLPLVIFGLVACEPSTEPSMERSISKDAKLETLRSLEEDLEAERDPKDGGGTAWFEPEAPETLLAGEPARFSIVYEAGPLGIDVGGAVFLQPSPFWGWDPPQTEVEGAPGYTEVATDVPGPALETRSLGGMLAIHVLGKRLEPGERVRIRYQSRADRFAERRERIFVGVDGNGDGVRALVAESPFLDVEAGHPARLVLTLPTTAHPGGPVRLVAAVVDGSGNTGVDFEGELRLEPLEGLELPESAAFSRGDAGRRTLEGIAIAPGLYRVRASTNTGLAAESNPLVVSEEVPRVLWADLHGHSQLSDGTGTPDDYFAYARDVAALDVAALTDHDHWGMRFLDRHEELWKSIEKAAARYDEPGRFVALVGYEWTNWKHGHRHVLYFEDAAEVLSSLDPRYETPELLWDALDGRSAITVAHHSAGGPVSTNWDFVPPPEIEPVTEIVSVHGSSEASDTPGRIYGAVAGNFVRDVLDRGLRFGFIGSGDGHDGHPGLAHLASPSGGLAAVFSEEVTRESVLAALRARRVYATNGARIFLRMWVDGEPMGAVASFSGEEPHELRLRVAATAPLDRVEVIRSGAIVAELDGGSRRELSKSLELPPLAPGEYVYARVVQEDGGVAWTSPVFAH